jgi:branched-chain amino acid transport system ATP-binding protein
MLDIRNLDVHYRGIQALRGVSLTVRKGEIFTVIGPNGAGKSSLMNALSGIVQAGGEILFEGEPLARMPAHKRARAGIIQVPEGRRVIAPLSVAENLELGRQAAGGRGSDAADLQRVHALFPVLKDRSQQASGSLSGGQQQMLAIGRALMGRPKVLLLDEPSLGLAPVVIKDVFGALKRLNEQGLTILLVEQNAKLALEAGHRAYVMESGVVTLSGAARELLHDEGVRRAYLGEA